MSVKLDYSRIPLPSYQTLGMRNREPKPEHIPQGWHPRMWANAITLYCCNFCPFDSPNLADTVQHLFLRHWLPQQHQQKVEDVPIVQKPLEDQLSEADALLNQTMQDLLNSGEITQEQLTTWQES